MMRLIRRSRQFFRELVLRLWVRPLSRLLRKVATIRPLWARRLLSWSIIRAVWLSQLLRSTLVVWVRRLEGPDWSVIYIGEGDSLDELRHVLFQEPVQVTSSRRIFIWQVPGIARQFVREGFLVVCELNRLLRWLPKTAYFITLPPVVRQVIELTQPLEVYRSTLKKKMRRHLHQMEQQGFTHKISRRPEDFEHFYYQMYLPFVQQQYGERATITGYNLARHYFEHGELIFVYWNDRLVGGGLEYIIGDTYQATLTGVYPDFTHLTRQGLSHAMYWFDICRAHQLGARRIDLGRSRARLSDGVFEFKRQWKALVEPVEFLHVHWLFLAEDISPSLCRHLNDRQFVVEKDGRFWCGVLETDQVYLTEAEYKRLNKLACQAGLAGLLVIKGTEISRSSSALQPVHYPARQIEC